MKSIGYILIGLVSLFTFTVPSRKIEEIPHFKEVKINKNIDSLHQQLMIRTDSLESMKIEVIQLQKDIGVRK